MTGQVRVEEVTREEHKQDCGCGCGGALCGTTHQEVIWVSPEKAMAAKKARAEQCDCGCECCS